MIFGVKPAHLELGKREIENKDLASACQRSGPGKTGRLADSRLRFQLFRERLSFRIVLSIHGSDFPGSEIGCFEPGNVFQDLETGKNSDGLRRRHLDWQRPSKCCGSICAFTSFY
jgi:hypothetical protein